MSFAQKQMLKFLSAFEKYGISKFDFLIRKRSAAGDEIGCIHPSKHLHLAGVSLAKLQEGNVMAFLRAQNALGHDISFRPNGADHPALFLDDLTIEDAWHCAYGRNGLVIQTSADNTQLWLIADSSLGAERRKRLERLLAERFSSDGSAADGVHFGRLPGFKNWKPGRKACWINFLGESKGECVVANESEWSGAAAPSIPKGGGAVLSLSFTISSTESIAIAPVESDPARHEFGWAINAFRRGLSKNDVLAEILARANARKKAGATSYAERTVSRAQSAADMPPPEA